MYPGVLAVGIYSPVRAKKQNTATLKVVFPYQCIPEYHTNRTTQRKKDRQVVPVNKPTAVSTGNSADTLRPVDNLNRNDK